MRATIVITAGDDALDFVCRNILDYSIDQKLVIEPGATVTIAMDQPKILSATPIIAPPVEVAPADPPPPFPVGDLTPAQA